MQSIKKIKVLAGQSLLNIACQYCGTAEALQDLILLNGLEYTEDLKPGQILEIPETEYFDRENVRYFENRGIFPASAITDEFINTITDDGIGEMIINETFIVKQSTT